MSARTRFIHLCVLSICFAVPGLGSAAKCGGTNINNTVTWEPVEISKGTTLATSRVTSVIVSDDPKAPFHLVSGECIGTFLIVEGKMRGGGSCARRDKDGDVLNEEWETVGGKGTAKIAGGTGKFANTTGTTEWQNTQLHGKTAAVRWTGDCR
jgi:hypothetical protein